MAGEPSTTSAPAPPRELMGWDDLGVAARGLATRVVADGGRTLELAKGFCAGQVGEVRAAVLYEKPRSIVECEYVWRRTDRWVVFPWSAEPPVTAGAAP